MQFFAGDRMMMMTSEKAGSRPGPLTGRVSSAQLSASERRKRAHQHYHAHLGMDVRLPQLVYGR